MSERASHWLTLVAVALCFRKRSSIGAKLSRAYYVAQKSLPTRAHREAARRDAIDLGWITAGSSAEITDAGHERLARLAAHVARSAK